MNKTSSRRDKDMIMLYKNKNSKYLQITRDQQWQTYSRYDLNACMNIKCHIRSAFI